MNAEVPLKTSALPTSSSTIYRCCRRFVEEGLDHALSNRSRPGGTRKLDAKDVATLVAIACSKAPSGRKRWTLKLLNERFIALTDHESVSSETLRRRMNELDLKPWQKRMWCIADVTPGFIARMEKILQLYALPEDPEFPVVCFDETLKQLVSEVVPPLPMSPGQSLREDHHYARNGSTSLAMFFCPHRKWREVRVLKERTYAAFAYLMRELVDVHFPTATRVRVVMDNLNTHCAGALYKTFPPEEARRILDRLEFNFTPVHASWLNMVEIELGVLARQCLDRRLGSREEVAREVKAWVERRNAEEATIRWMFDIEAARQKFARHYPDIIETESPLLAA